MPLSEDQDNPEWIKEVLPPSDNKKRDHTEAFKQSDGLSKNTQHQWDALIKEATRNSGFEMSAERQAKIDAILLRESAYSDYIKKQQRGLDERVNQKIEQMRNKLDAYIQTNLDWHTKLTEQANIELSNLSSQSRLTSFVVVVIDNFFISCELLDKPQWQAVPCCVGSPTSIISASNEKAQEYGVRSSMDGRIGQTLVRELSSGSERLKFFDLNHQLYKKKSEQVLTILSQYDPQLSSHNMGEAYLNLEPYMALKLQVDEKGEQLLQDHNQIKNIFLELDESISDFVSDNETDENDSMTEPIKRRIQSKETYYIELQNVVREIRTKILELTGLTCSAGIGPNYLIAKIASNLPQPNGQVFVDGESVKNFMHPLPISKVPGIGRVMEKTLNAFGIHTVLDLYKERGLLSLLFQPIWATFLLRVSVGFGNSSGIKEPDPGDSRMGMSLSSGSAIIYNLDEMILRLQDIVARLSHRMRQVNIRARTFTTTVKLHTFDVYSKTKSIKAGRSTNDEEEIKGIVHELFNQIRQTHQSSSKRTSSDERNKSTFSVRLLGLRCSNLVFDSNPKENLPSIHHFLEGSDQMPKKMVHLPSLAPQGIRSKPEMNLMKYSCDAKVNNILNEVSFSYKQDKHNQSNVCANKTTVASPVCPICHTVFLDNSNEELNRHIDSCLSYQAIQNMSQEKSST